MSNIKISGEIDITPPLNDYDYYYFRNFLKSPHFKRHVEKTKKNYNGTNGYYGDYGQDGEFFIYYIIDDQKIEKTDDIISTTEPPPSLPTVYCPWRLNISGNIITPIESKTYRNNYKWLKWLIENFFKPYNYKLNGHFKVETETYSRKIVITDNLYKYYAKSKINGEMNNSILTNGKDKFHFNKILKTNTQIISQLIEMTKNNVIIWEYEKIMDGSKYTTKININNNISIGLSFVNRQLGKDYLMVYIDKNNVKKYYKNIKSFKLKELSMNIKDKELNKLIKIMDK
jgi:ribosomal protein L18